MSEIYNDISSEELEILRKSIADVAVLGAISDDGKIEEAERKSALKLASQRTFTAKPVLQDFYKEVEEHLESDFDTVLKSLPEGDSEVKQEFLRGELDKVEPILKKLTPGFGEHFLKSQKTFAEHVFKANSSFFAKYFKSMDGDMGTKIFGEQKSTDI